MAGLSLKDTDRFLPLNLGATAHATLQRFIDIDVSAEDLVQILRADRRYQALFREFVDQKIKVREPGDEEASDGVKPKVEKKRTPTHRLIGLLGMIGSRNLILALRMNEAVAGEFPRGAEGKLDLKAADYLKCGPQAEEFFQRNRIAYPETAYAAGVYFDWIYLKLKAQGSLPKLEPFFQQTWKTALRAGLIAYELAKVVPGQLPQQCFPAMVAAYGGKLLLAESYGDAYVEFLKTQAGSIRLDSLSELILERENFGLSFEEVAAHALAHFSIFSGYAPAVRHAREPYLLRGLDTAHERQANILLIADRAAQSNKIPNGETDPSLALLGPRACRTLGISPARLIETLKKVAAYR
ncbi:MAG: hypothetical protein EOP11_07760 [Proteobacteria bacterium]|nr:MAG: hypothetical protein EOP11_07760 [Pseudomonadota bacterium]